VEPRKPVLVADGIENPWNARTLLDVAAMFATSCRFRDRASLAIAWPEAFPDDGPLPLVTDAALRGPSPLVALENVPGAASVWGFRQPAGERPALVVGNERRGIGKDILLAASHCVSIPLASRRLNTLNVGAAAAVALYYLRRGGGGLHTAGNPSARRPELLFLAGTDHVELGGALRSAGAFGWARLFVEDRSGVWFGCNRATRAEGRAAARAHRNPLQLIPVSKERRYGFDEVCVISASCQGTPLPRARLARGGRQLIALPDESAVSLPDEDWGRLGKEVRFVSLDLPAPSFPYHYRATAAIALAEVARQVGQRAGPARGRPRPPAPVYDRALEVLRQEASEVVFQDDLQDY